MLVSVNPGLIIWTIVTFLLLVFVLGKFGWKPIISALEGREKNISDALADAENQRLEAERILEQYKDTIAKAESEARDIIQGARETSEQLRRETEASARVESQRMLDQARREIQGAKEAALREIRDVVADLAVEAAGKIVQEHLDPERHRKMIDDMIVRLPETRSN